MPEEATVDSIVDDFNDQIAEVADDTDTWTQEESAEIYEGIADACKMRADMIRSEIAEG